MSAAAAVPAVLVRRRRWHSLPVFAGLMSVTLLGIIAARLVAPPHLPFVEYRGLVPGDIPAAVAVGPVGAVWFTFGIANALWVLRDGGMQGIGKVGDNLESLGMPLRPDGW